MRGAPIDYPAVIAELRRQNGDRMATAVAMGISICAVRNAAQRAGRAGIPLPTGPAARTIEYEPTAAEIAAHCEAFQRRWTPYERWVRSGRREAASIDHRGYEPAQVPEVCLDVVRDSAFESRMIAGS